MTISPLPGFTAAASLYQSSAHYRTGTRATNLRRHQLGPVRLSAIDVPGEVIEIEDDAPWSPPSWGGHTGPGTSGPPGETGGGGSGGGDDSGIPSKNPPNPGPKDGEGCSTRQIMSKAAKPCLDQREHDLMNNVKNPHRLQGTGEKKGKAAHPKMECCQDWGDVTICEEL